MVYDNRSRYGLEERVDSVFNYVSRTIRSLGRLYTTKRSKIQTKDRSELLPTVTVL